MTLLKNGLLGLAMMAFAGMAFTGPVLAQDDVPDSLTILFDLGSTQVRADQRDVLDQAARLFRDGNPVVMIVSGSADTVGDPAANLDLSVIRARSVADGLVSRGIPIERLQVLGRGNSELPVPTGDGVANQDNRSVNITWR
ncbi:MAG: OmpA family protein [Pseudomonadota bacterium]